MLKVITMIECDRCDAELKTESDREQVGLIVMAAREGGWIAFKTNKRRRSGWLCPKCSGEAQRGDYVILDDPWR